MSRTTSGRKGLGEILLEADLINRDQLTEALGLQASFGERLASILVRKRMLTEKFAVTYLGRQLGVAPIDLSRTELDLELLDLVSIDLCERHHVFPVRIEGGRLLLAMTNPRDQALVDRLEADTGARLTPLIALESSLKNAIAEARRALKEGRRTFKPDIAALDRAERSSPPAEARRPLEDERPTVKPDVMVLEPSERSSPAVEAEPNPPASGTPSTLEWADAPTVVSREPEPRTPSPPEAPPASSVDAPTILLAAQASGTTVKNLAGLLRDRQYQVVCARDGRDVLVLVRQTMPDLVVAEGILPELDGYEACRKIKGDERFRALPVILVATPGLGWRFAADVREKYGADEVVDGGCDSLDLARRVDFHLNRDSSGTPHDAEERVRQILKAGVVALKKGRHQEAVDVLVDALAIDPFNDLVHYYLGMAYEKLARVFDAMHHFEQAVHANPDFYDAIVSLANLYQGQGLRRKAVDMWELALQATSDEQARERMKAHILAQL